MWSLRRGEPRVKNASKLYVQPAELAGKLVKEMEDDKVSRGSHVSVRNKYTVYLCREDYERWRGQEEQLLAKLEMHLTRHVRSRRYELPGAISVKMTADPDLKLGHFGICAERELPSGVVQKARVSSAAAVVGSAGAASGGTGLASVAPAGMAAARAAAARAAAPRAAADGTASPSPVSARPSGVSRAEQVGGSTEIISPSETAELSLVKQTIVLKANNQEYEFNKGRVIVGRSRDVDFRIENADVSRRHAAFYWSDGNIMVKDLGSTNGTMVNGYPVDSTVVHPGDVVLVGDCFITVESR